MRYNVFNLRNAGRALGMAVAVALTAGALIASTAQRETNGTDQAEPISEVEGAQPSGR